MKIYEYGSTYALSEETKAITHYLNDAMSFQKRIPNYLIPNNYWIEDNQLYINWILRNTGGERLWAYEYDPNGRMIGHRIDDITEEVSKIYVTGDTHSDFRRFSNAKMKQNGMILRPQDYLIICGDFGLLWNKSEYTYYNMQIFADKPYTTLWVQGNHENYDMIAEYPVTEWHGGKVRHIIRDKVILLERGQVFNINGKSFFTFGGAKSHDIQGGLLDRKDPEFDNKRKRAEYDWLPYRIINESWWEAELPTEKEMFEGLKNLGKVDYKVDYVITHCASSHIQRMMDPSGMLYKPDYLTDYLENIEKRIEYKHWYFGHYHDNKKIDDKHSLLYEDIDHII